MRLHVEQIKEEGLSLEFREDFDRFKTLSDMVGEGDCAFVAPVVASLHAKYVDDLIEIDGRVETRLRLFCSRCLGGYEAPIAADFSVTFVRELPEGEASDDEGTEVSPEEMGLNLYHGDYIDLDDLIAEQVVLALPFHPLCSENCKGLCPNCGADLNNGDCGCEKKPFLNKFSALKDFKVDK